MKIRSHKGFTLVEMAIVLAIIALILGTGLTVLSAQQDQRRVEDTKARMEVARDALIGFAIINGRLPCPAEPTTPSGTTVGGIAAGFERPAIAAGCTGGAAAVEGVLPWATLGIAETDGWGHRFTYRVTGIFAGTTPFTLTSSGDIFIRNTSVAGGVSLASTMPAVIVSHGMNGLRAYLPSGSRLPVSTDADEAENSNNDANFISKELTTAFDDQLIWISPNILFNRMVQAGKLP